MAYTPIQPLPTVTNPLLGIASGALSYIKEVNEIKRKEGITRQNEIVKLLNDVDFPTALEMVDKKKQMEIYKGAENSLMKILSKSAKGNGVVSMEDRIEAERVIKTLKQELDSIKLSGDKYSKVMESAAKNPGLYTPESLRKVTDIRTNTGDFREDLLEYTPVPFSAVENIFYTKFKEGKKAVTTVENGREIVRDVINLPDSEKQGNYEAIRNSVPGVAVNEIKEFQKLKENDPDTYNKYKLEGIPLQEAAKMWALNDVAPKLGTGRITDEKPYKPTAAETKKANEIEDIKGIEMEDGSMEWKFSTTPVVFSDSVSIYDEKGKLKKQPISGGKIVGAGYGKLPDGSTGKYAKVIASLPSKVPGFKSTPIEYIVPYTELESSLKRKVNLIGIDQMKGVKNIQAKKTDPYDGYTKEKYEELVKLGLKPKK